jgi:hypothetical protein
MVRHWHVLGACILLGVVVVLMTSNGEAADKEEIAAAQKKVLEIADDIANKKTEDASKKAAAFVKPLQDYKDLEAAMKIMALRDNGGLGFGPKGKFSPDGIEAKLINLGLRKLLKEDELKAQADDLAKSANIVAAVSEMALAKPPAKKLGDKDPKDWMKWAQNMKEGAAALSDAVAKKDAEAIRSASEKLNGSCSDCHNVFKKK